VEGLRAAVSKVKGAELILITPDEELEVEGRAQIDENRGFSARYNFTLNRSLAAKFLSYDPRPTVAIATDETMAHVLLTFLVEQGLSIPRDVSVACYGGTYLSEYGMLPLTCVEQPIVQIARIAVEMVTDQRVGQRPKRTEVKLVPPTLSLRKSVASINVLEASEDRAQRS